MTTLTGQVIDRVRSIGALPADADVGARHCILDTLGVAIGGVGEPVTSHIRDEVLAEAGAPQATLWGTGERVSRRQAALVNGTAAHAIDFDDVVSRMDGHPSAPLLPALFAAAEGRKVSGARFLSAFVAGFEAEALVGRLMKPSHYARGFHATATVGAFGAATAVAHILDLDVAEWEHALGIAGASASGLKSMFGSMTKPLQVGAASESGLRAALLAARGVTAHPDVLGVPQGFVDTQSDGTGTPELWDWSGFSISEVLFKYHAACYLTHSAIEGARALRSTGVRPEQVESIELIVPPGHTSVCDIAAPSTPLEAKFSLRFTAATALVTGDLSEAAFTQSTVEDPLIVELRDKVTVSHRSDSARSTIVRLAGVDGSQQTVEVDVNRPTPPAEFGRRWDLLVTKFHSLVDPVMGASAADRIVREVAELGEAPTIDSLAAAVSPSGHAA